jgi:hypothetical protein
MLRAPAFAGNRCSHLRKRADGTPRKTKVFQLHWRPACAARGRLQRIDVLEQQRNYGDFGP